MSLDYINNKDKEWLYENITRIRQIEHWTKRECIMNITLKEKNYIIQVRTITLTMYSEQYLYEYIDFLTNLVTK